MTAKTSKTVSFASSLQPSCLLPAPSFSFLNVIPPRTHLLTCICMHHRLDGNVNGNGDYYFFSFWDWDASLIIVHHFSRDFCDFTFPLSWTVVHFTCVPYFHLSMGFKRKLLFSFRALLCCFRYGVLDLFKSLEVLSPNKARSWGGKVLYKVLAWLPAAPPALSYLWGRDRQIPGARCPFSLAKAASSRFKESPCLKESVRKEREQDTWLGLSLGLPRCFPRHGNVPAPNFRGQESGCWPTWVLF